MESDVPSFKKRGAVVPAHSLPDDVLGLIGEFAPWINDAASSARRTCKAMQLGVERTAKKLASMELQRVMPLMPMPLMPLMRNNLLSSTAATGRTEWKRLMLRVYGACMGCDGSHWNLLACSHANCFRMICEACCLYSLRNAHKSAGTAPVAWRCANHGTLVGAWRCANHDARARCSLCDTEACLSCAQGHGMRKCTECRAYVCRPCRRKAPWVGLVCNDCDFFAD